MTSSHLLSFRKLIDLILFFVQRYVTAFHCFPRGIKEKKRLKSNDFQIIALCFIYFFSCCSRIFFEESESYCWPRGTSAHGRDKIVPGWSAVVLVEYSWSELRRLCQRTYSLGHMDWTVRGQTHYVTATYTSDWFWAPLGGTGHSLSSLLFFFSLDTILNTTNVSWWTFFLEKLTQQYCLNLEPWKQKAFLSRHVLINENVRSDWGLCEPVPKMFFFRSLLNDFAFDRFSKMVTLVTSLMAATKTIRAGCVSFAVRATPTNRTYMHSNIVETSFIEHSRKFLQAENF